MQVYYTSLEVCAIDFGLHFKLFACSLIETKSVSVNKDDWNFF